MDVVFDALVTAGIAYVGIRFPRYRKPIAALFAIILIAVILLRLQH